MIFLCDNVLLERELTFEAIKNRLLGKALSIHVMIAHIDRIHQATGEPAQG
jgi:hypothetical protein